jgi:hypothetical protein
MQLAGGKATNIFSADNFFMKEGKYCFNQEELWLAHKNCRYTAFQAMKTGQPIVVIDNTNIKIRDLVPYAVEGWWYDYQISIEEPISPWWLEEIRPALADKLNEERMVKASEFLFTKNVHSVPQETILGMMRGWQECTMPVLFDRIFGPDHGLSV